MAFTTCFYRDPEVSKRFAAAGINKPPGWITSEYKTTRKEEVERTVAAINNQKPVFPAHLVELS